MSDNKRKKMEAKKAKAKEKRLKFEEKMRGKAASAAGAFVVAAFLGSVLWGVCGCATSEPASRVTKSEYGDIRVEIADGAKSNSVTITIGDGAYASADSKGSTETQTANPTTDVKPQTTLTYGLASATPAGAKWIDALDEGCAKCLSSWLGTGNANGTMTVTRKDGTTETVTCKDGVCTTAAGECVTCHE